MSIFLETERLILKTHELSDLQNLLSLRTDPDVMRYAGRGIPQTADEIKKFLDICIQYQKKHGIGFCSVFEKASGEFVGQAGLFHVGFHDEQPEIEIGYRLHKKFWNKGFATEIVRELIRWGFKHLQVNKLVAFVHQNNLASHRVLQKCDLQYLGIVSSWYGDVPKYEIYKNEAIELVPYNPQWPEIAAKEIAHLHTILPARHILDIQHVGSTAIPGIQSKPIIDIQIAVDSLATFKLLAINALQKSGYVFWQDNPDTERLFFAKGMPPYGEKRTHHVHIVEPASKHWREKIRFRNYLSSNPEIAKQYEILKLDLMKKFTHDREKYTEGKTKFISHILSKAESRVKQTLPFFVFLTGASGAGKTTIINEIKNKQKDSAIVYLHFDDIGVPSLEEMKKIYGSPEAWQKAMTYHWVKKIIERYAKKKRVILEGQINMDYIFLAMKGFDIANYQILLVHCENRIRHQRLQLHRQQPELVNDNMDSWSEFLKRQAMEKGIAILDTSKMTREEMVSQFLQWLSQIKY